ncbi:MAG: Fructose-1-phosphate phosphatase YqaB [Planctomycetes bacterium]|nr:Fructose-1-phosphate phosphatase YqaB [Planctomycetota bacterium]
MSAGARGVLFDLDGVLIDSEGLWYRASQRVLADFGVSVTKEVYAREWVSLGRGSEYAVRTFGLPVTPEELKRRRAPIVRDLVVAEAQLMPGALAALERLSAAYPLALATNSAGEIVHPLFDRLGIRRFFRDVIVKERYAKPKPAPDAFLAAAAALSLPPSSCAVIEDAEKGVVAAHAAGARCIVVPNEWTRGNDFGTADVVVTSLDDVTVALVSDVLRNGA